MRQPPLPAKTLVVVPTYNEHENLPELAERFFTHLPEGRLLVVDDDSPDGTAAVARGLAGRYPGLELLERRGQRGLGRAYIAGLEYGLAAGFEVVGTMDADLSHDPRYLGTLLECLADHDVAIGSRYVKDGGTVNWRLRRILLSWLANRFAAWVLTVPAHDLTSGFRLYRAAALRSIDLRQITSNGYSFLVEFLYQLNRSGASIGEVPIVFVDRTLGRSKLGTREIYIGAYRLFALRMRRKGPHGPIPTPAP